MLKIRLQRIGKRGQAHYKIVVMEHTLKTKGEYLDLLGWYNPHSKELKVDEDKLKKYLADGVQMSPTINNLFINRKIIEGKKVTSWKPKKKEATEKPAGAPTPQPETAPAAEPAPQETPTA